jgi:hypothetical protein
MLTARNVGNVLKMASVMKTNYNRSSFFKMQRIFRIFQAQKASETITYDNLRQPNIVFLKSEVLTA